jgi:hypothetical protein
MKVSSRMSGEDIGGDRVIVVGDAMLDRHGFGAVKRILPWAPPEPDPVISTKATVVDLKVRWATWSGSLLPFVPDSHKTR